MGIYSPIPSSLTLYGWSFILQALDLYQDEVQMLLEIQPPVSLSQLGLLLPSPSTASLTLISVFGITQVSHDPSVWCCHYLILQHLPTQHSYPANPDCPAGAGVKMMSGWLAITSLTVPFNPVLVLPWSLPLLYSSCMEPLIGFLYVIVFPLRHTPRFQVSATNCAVVLWVFSSSHTLLFCSVSCSCGYLYYPAIESTLCRGQLRTSYFFS